MNDLKYFRNDKLDLVNKEKQRFGFRKLSSGKIASVLLGVTIFGGFALNGQVVKADTTTDGSQPTAVVDEAESTQNNEEQGATATFNKEEQSRQDNSAQNYGSHNSLTITSEGGEETTETKTGKPQADSTDTDTKNANREGTTSDKNGAGAAVKVRIARSAAMQLAARIPVSDQPTAEKIAKKYTHIDVDHAQKILDYYNNVGTITKILGLKSSDISYGGPWLEGIIGLTTSNTERFTNNYVDRIVGIYVGNMVKGTQAKIDERIKNLQVLSSQYPNDQDIKNAIDKLTALKDNVTSENVTNAAAMADTIDQLDKYGSQQAYSDLQKKAAENPNPPAEVNKDALQSAVNEAATVKAANSQASEDKQKAYQDAIAAGQNVLNDGKASQADVTNALSKIEQAKKDMTVSAIQKAVDEASDTKGKPNYYNASDEAKKAYNDALDKANRVLADPKATQDQLDEANSALTSAKAGLTGVATDNSGLEKAVNEAATVKAANSQASEDKQKAYQDAIAAGQNVLNDGKASQADVTNALSKIEQAKKDMTVSAIQKAVDEASDTKGKPNYYNASDEAKKAYNDALDKANRVLADPKATQDQLDEANSALTSAKAGLTGVATDNSGLEKAVNEAATVKAANSQASEDKQKAYQDAIAAGQNVLNDGKASQADVTNALSKIEQAKKDMTVSAIQKAVDEASDTKGKPNYYNASDEAKKAYNDALDKANRVLADPKATQDQLDEANSALTSAKAGLTGVATDNSGLEKAVNEAATVKAANSQASEDKQKAYQDAIAAGQNVLNDGKASQADVTNALSKIEQAKKDMTVSAIQKAVDEASDTKGKPNYYNASDEAKKAYNDALDKANRVLADPKATQDQLDEANSALTSAKAGLTGVATDNSGLEKAVNEAATVKAANSQASEDKQKAYQDAIAAGQNVLNDGKASQADVTNALSKIEQAKKDMTVSAIQKAVDEASDTKGKPNYYNASDEAKKAYNDALDKANRVLADPKATQDQLDEANSALTSAKAGLTGVATDNSGLEKAVNEAATVKAANSQASEDKQKAYQDAIAAGQNVLNDGKASQADVTNALSKIEQAKKDMTVSAIQKAVDEASDTKGKPNYYNASDEAKKAYNDALDKANRVLADPKATQDQLDEANSALTSAKAGLTGVATDNSGLEKAVNEAATVKAANSQASEDKQKAYQDAIAAGQNVLNDGKASQADVTNALSKIEQAKKDMTVSAIQKAVDEASDTKGKPNYYNASDEAKKAYNDALDKANRVLADPKATQDQLDEANSALTSAKAGLTGVATDNSGLEKAVNEAATVKAANSQASEDKQKAYQDAIAAGQNVLNDGKASQADVTNALSKIEQAKKDMTVSAIQKAVDEASDTKGKPNYYNASDEAKKAYNDALDKANRVLADPKATQDQLDEANSALTSAKAGLTGVATDNSGLEKAVNEAATVKAANSQASEDKQKAYQDAIAAGQNVLNDGKASQADVTNALSKIEQAKKDMTVSAIQKAVDEASDTKGKPNYYNASDEAKKAYNDALDKANRVLADPKATQDQLDEANSALTSAKAGLTGVATDNSGLEKAVNEAATVKAANSQASEDKQKAYQDAIAAGQNVLNDGKASQADVTNALSKIEQAKKDMTVSAIQKAVDEASDTKGKPNYYNASDEAKKAYNDALDKANRVLADPKATQDQLDEANSALTSAKAGLTGVATDNSGLEKAVNEAATVKAANSQASEDKQKAYQDAIAAGQNVLNDGKASQADVTNALSKIEQAKKDMTVSAIQKAVDEASDTKGKPNYYNASDEAKKAYNDALDKANRVLADPKATQDQLDEANSALTSAKAGLTGVATDNSGLEKAVNEAATVKAANSQASEDKQKAYQDAIAAGQNVLNDGKASQADVTNALSKIEQAKKDMTVSAIQKAVDEASDTKGKPNYYNASDEAKKAYNDALDKANRVLADPKATQDQLDEANSALTSAKAGLTGVATDNSGLEKAVNEAATVKAANSQASEDKQKAYQDAIAAGQNVLNDGKASQADVTNALSKIEQAKKDMTVSAIQKAVDEASDTKGKPNYYNASDEAKKAYNDALDKANRVLADPKATQDQLDEANSALTSAKAGLTGVATDNSGLEKAVNEANTTKLDDKYYNASQDKKQAYDEALAQATKLLNDKNASQKAVAEAVANLEKAKAELNGEPNFIGGDYTPSEPSTPSTETPAEKTTEKILMHASYLYDNKGIKIDKPTVKSYVTVVVAENPVTINGIKYYKVAGKDEYIKAGNIDGTLRVITHNSYIYNNKGKATRNKGIKRLVKKTRIVRTYGAPINIKGHMMYRIAKNRYIKARNFEGTLRRLSHNSFVYDENGKATRNKGIRRLLKKSRVVRTFDAPVKINGHMMYRVDNGYVKVKNFK